MDNTTYVAPQVVELGSVAELTQATRKFGRLDDQGRQTGVTLSYGS